MVTTAQRREQIIEFIQNHGEGRVDAFAEQFGVSRVTIRNDLSVLERQGCIQRVHGGAVLNQRFAFDRSLKVKGTINTSVKNRIAQKALEYIHAGDTIILDSGSTTELIAGQLDPEQPLVVMTNAINIACQLASSPAIEVLVAGGSLRQDSFSVHGDTAEQQLANYRFDTLFLGVDGFDLDSGITTPHKGEAQLNRVMCRVARKVIAVTDSSKFGRKSFCIITAASQIDVLITDSGIPDHYLSTLREMGVEVCLADAD